MKMRKTNLCVILLLLLLLLVSYRFTNIFIFYKHYAKFEYFAILTENVYKREIYNISNV